MSCNRNTLVCLHQKWTETGRRDCFDCCPERQSCSITPPSTFLILFPGICRTQSVLNLSWPVAVSQTSTDSHVCIELLWETQQGSGGLVARETQRTVRKWPTELSSLQTGSLQTFCLFHRTLYAFLSTVLLYWFIPREKKGVLAWTWLNTVDLSNQWWLFVLQYNNHFLKFLICFCLFFYIMIVFNFLIHLHNHTVAIYTTNTLLAIIDLMPHEVHSHL